MKLPQHSRVPYRCLVERYRNRSTAQIRRTLSRQRGQGLIPWGRTTSRVMGIRGDYGNAAWGGRTMRLTRSRSTTGTSTTAGQGSGRRLGLLGGLVLLLVTG